MNTSTQKAVVAMIFLLAVVLALQTSSFAQPAGRGMPGDGMPPGGGRGGRGMMGRPRAGVTPLPILPALPTYEDTDFYAEKDVPHGKVEQVNYTNYEGQEKRMHIYLPPGYEDDTETRYPVLYLNHGGGGDDTHWSSHDQNRGNADYILDNLIAEGKAKPMIVVMPNTSELASHNPPEPGVDDACTQEYLKDIIPYVDSNYRTIANREKRALAGLSMGGFVVMHTGLSHLDTFSELYVYSSGHTSDETLRAFEENFKDLFENPDATNELFRVPYYIAAGETDMALRNGQKVLALFNQACIRNFWVLSTGGHEWTNWRRYLYQTAQIMFPEDAN